MKRLPVLYARLGHTPWLKAHKLACAAAGNLPSQAALFKRHLHAVVSPASVIIGGQEHRGGAG